MLKIFGSFLNGLNTLKVWPWSTLIPVGICIIILAYREGYHSEHLKRKVDAQVLMCNEDKYKFDLDAERAKNKILEDEIKKSTSTVITLKAQQKAQDQLLDDLQRIANDISIPDDEISPRTREFIKKLKEETDSYYVQN